MKNALSPNHCVIWHFRPHRPVSTDPGDKAALVALVNATTVTSGKVADKTAQSTFKIASTSSSVPNFYLGARITIGEERKTITAYDGQKKQVTVAPAFAVGVSSSVSSYSIDPGIWTSDAPISAWTTPARSDPCDDSWKISNCFSSTGVARPELATKSACEGKGTCSSPEDFIGVSATPSDCDASKWTANRWKSAANNRVVCSHSGATGLGDRRRVTEINLKHFFVTVTRLITHVKAHNNRIYRIILG